MKCPGCQNKILIEEGEEKLCGDVHFQCGKCETLFNIPLSRRIYPTGIAIFALSFLVLFLVPPPFAVLGITVWGALVMRWVLQPLILSRGTAESFGDRLGAMD